MNDPRSIHAYNACKDAIYRRDLNTIIVFFPHICDAYRKSFMWEAVYYIRYEIVKYLYSRGIQFYAYSYTMLPSTYGSSKERHIDRLDKMHTLQSVKLASFLRRKHIHKFYRLLVLFNKKKWLGNLRRKVSIKYIHIAIQSKPPNFLGSTECGILYEIDACRSDIFTL